VTSPNDPASPDLDLQGARRPDILVVVMDCVRASNFSAASPTLAAMPFCSRLAKESAQFLRTVSPASWTIPAHASLFTGLYPWEHRLHARGESRLSPAYPHLATELGRAGYRTASFSANPFIGDPTGLASGFQIAGWGGWWERYARHMNAKLPPGRRTAPVSERGGLERLVRSNLWPVLRSTSRSSLRHPLGFHLGNRLAHMMRHRDGECPACVAPWIEPNLAAWMAEQPPDAPRFVFINLMEAHEPYVVTRGTNPVGDLWRSLTLRQDFEEWLEGEWAPSSAERATLRRLYSGAIQSLDHRIEAIARVFQEAGRWDSTVTILTSDHGQGLGEEGMLSHGMSVADSVARIPLWVHAPGGALAGRTTTSWASLTDVAPTCARLAGIPTSGLSGGPGLLPLLERERPDPVWSMSEGVIWRDAREHLTPDQLARYDRVLVAGFVGNSKVVYDATHHRVSLQTLFGQEATSDPPAVSEEEMLRGMVTFMDRIGTALRPEPDSLRSTALYSVEEMGYA
jgi:arylsulfatase A-like enzyme